MQTGKVAVHCHNLNIKFKKPRYLIIFNTQEAVRDDVKEGGKTLEEMKIFCSCFIRVY